MNLKQILPKKSGRGFSGRVSVRHQGGRQKRYLRIVDWKRDKRDIPAAVAAIEYDPNRTGDLALLQYPDGERRYILCPEGLKVGDTVIAGEKVEIGVGNALPLINIPVGTIVHNIELHPGRGAKIIRSAGGAATVVAQEDGYTQVKMSSGEIRRINSRCVAT